jgi:hypothetical protein
MPFNFKINLPFIDQEDENGGNVTDGFYKHRIFILFFKKSMNRCF